MARYALPALAVCWLLASCGQDAPQSSSRLDEPRRLAALCEVWGLLKYHHPDVVQRADWDEVLISAVPRFKAAETPDAFEREVRQLLDEAGPVAGRAPSSDLDPTFRWIDDAQLFPEQTRDRLRAIAAALPVDNRYVARAPNFGNPDFDGDRRYASTPDLPDEPTRLLALFRFWNMVQYFFPYRDVMDRDWLEVLPDLIPKFLAATSALEYHLAVAETTASIDDGHASAHSSVLDSHFGLRRVPLDFRLVEGRTIIARVFPRLYDGHFDLHVGDRVTLIDGVSPQSRRATLRKVMHGSNEVGLERNVHEVLQRTNQARLPLTVEGEDGRTAVWDVNAVPLDAPWLDLLARTPLTEILPGNVGYVHMGRLRLADVAGVMDQMRDTRGIVFDTRYYPNGTLFAISNYVHTTSRPFAKFQEPDFSRPGRLVWRLPEYSCPCPVGAYTPAASYTYTGRIALLVNEDTISQGEFTTMLLRTAPGALVVGSQTAGADGDVSNISLPGGISTRFTGLGVFYPDGTPTQRIGIVPDVVVRPTIQGLREGRDEVLEAAVALLQ